MIIRLHVHFVPSSFLCSLNHYLIHFIWWTCYQFHFKRQTWRCWHFIRSLDIDQTHKYDCVICIWFNHNQCNFKAIDWQQQKRQVVSLVGSGRKHLSEVRRWCIITFFTCDPSKASASTLKYINYKRSVRWPLEWNSNYCWLLGMTCHKLCASFGRIRDNQVRKCII